MPLKITVNEKRTSEFIISPVGSIDSETAEIFEKKVDSILALVPKIIIFNMEGVTYITSMGLSVMVKAEKAIKERGKTLVVVNVPPQIKKVFDVVASLPAMNVFESIKEADDYLLKIQRDEIEKQKGQ
jgi:anti-sigma B factor antagonist